MTGMRVDRARRSDRTLSCLGSRCWTRTNAMPLSNGRCDSIVVQASRPPADAPIPTTGKTSGRVALSEDGEDACDFTAVFFGEDRKSTRLNSSHANISYAVFCLKKKTTK